MKQPHTKHNIDMIYVMLYFGLKEVHAHNYHEIMMSKYDWKEWADYASENSDHLVEHFVKEWVANTPFAQRNG